MWYAYCLISPFVVELLEEIGVNTALLFQEVKGKNSDFMFGAQTRKSNELSLSETRKGISFSWPFDNKARCKKPTGSFDQETVTRDLGSGHLACKLWIKNQNLNIRLQIQRWHGILKMSLVVLLQLIML